MYLKAGGLGDWTVDAVDAGLKRQMQREQRMELERNEKGINRIGFPYIK